MNVHIVSNLDPDCGNAQYARNLQAALSRHFKTFLYPPAWSGMLQVERGDVAIVNYHRAVVPFGVQDVLWLKELGARVILLHQNSFPQGSWEPRALFDAVDEVVAHEKCAEGGVYIPHGIIDDMVTPDPRAMFPFNDPWVGTAGFDFPWKNFDGVIRVAGRLNANAMIVSPPRNSARKPSELPRDLMAPFRELAVEDKLLPERDVIRILARNDINMFLFNCLSHDDELGQTGSARLGIAARRPTLVTSHHKFASLREYEDELYFVTSEADAYYKCCQILHDLKRLKAVKVPDALIRDQGWTRVGEMWADFLGRSAK